MRFCGVSDRMSAWITWAIVTPFDMVMSVATRFLPSFVTRQFVAPFAFISVCLAVWVFTSRDDENVFAKRVWAKYYLYLEGTMFMVLSQDTRGIGPKKNPDPVKLVGDPDTQTKRFVFIRHGESEWNDVFNKGKNLGMIGRLFGAFWREFRLYPTRDSVFLDSSLNTEGIEQAKELREFITKDSSRAGASSETKLVLDILRGDAGHKSVVVSSNLRRALQTTTVALWPRLEAKSEKIIICSSLQEISRNVDTKALADRKEIPDLSKLAGHCASDGSFNPDQVYNPTENYGNKTLSVTGIKRMQKFNEWAFSRDEDTIIIGGHSLWFRSFFQTYLAHASTHDAKTKKLENSGVISFTLHRKKGDNGEPLYRVDEDSMESVYRGFTNK